MRLPHASRTPRRAWVSLWALLVLIAMLAALALAFNAAWLSTARQDLQSAADSAALAGSDQLLSDEWLRLNQPGVAALLDSARTTARDYAAFNRAVGRPVELVLDPSGPDVMIGSFDTSGAFIPAPDAPTLSQAEVVTVAARRLRSRNTGVPLLLGALLLTPSVDVQAMAAARLDRDVVGFYATTSQPIPIVPIGILSDPTAADGSSWENQIIGRNGPDEFAFDATNGFGMAADDVPEIDVELPLAPDGDLSTGNGYLLTFGTGAPQTQVMAGVSADDLAAQQGQLILAADDVLRVPATTGPTQSSAAYNELLANLEYLRQQQLPRVFPLVVTVSGTGEAQVNAFVAARVVRVVEQPGGPLTVRLQPTMRAVPQAITDASRRGTAYLLPSAYLARPRLVR